VFTGGGVATGETKCFAGINCTVGKEAFTRDAPHLPGESPTHVEAEAIAGRGCQSTRRDGGSGVGVLLGKQLKDSVGEWKKPAAFRLGESVVRSLMLGCGCPVLGRGKVTWKKTFHETSGR